MQECRTQVVDRFIPARMHRRISTADKGQEIDSDYSRVITPQRSKYLRFHCRSAPKNQSLSSFILQSLHKKPSAVQKQTIKPIKVLDAPDVIDNYYHNPVDWGLNDICIALDASVFLLRECSQVTELNRYSQTVVSSLKFVNESTCCLLGQGSGRVEVYDASRQVRIRTINAHYNRVGCLDSQSAGLFVSGSKDRIIKLNDLRLKKADVIALQQHKGQICGMSLNTNYLASGANDNRVIIWDLRHSKMITQIKSHKSAVKAISWCPWKHSLLASGGGCRDGNIILWNGNENRVMAKIERRAQVNGLLWELENRQLFSATSTSKVGVCTVWKVCDSYQLVQKYVLKSHFGRILGLTKNPRNNRQLCSVGSDETLRIWDISDEVQVKTEKSNTTTSTATPSSTFDFR